MSKKCIGCGNIIQENDKELCQRCFKIKHYNEYELTIKNNDDYLKILSTISKYDLVVYLTSVLNINVDYLNNFNNVILVLTKKDLLPKSVKDNKLINYLKNINYQDIEVISSVKNYNLDNLFTKIKKYNKTNKIYFVGNTNSGKSTLINKILKNYYSKNIEITTSLYPSTTIDKIEINLDDLTIVDTPGLIDNNSIINYLNVDTLKLITPKKEIKPKTIQIKGKGSYIINNFFRIDYDTKKSNSMTFYMSNNLNLEPISIKNSKLKNLNKTIINLSNNKDIVITDLCFIKFVEPIEVYIYTLDNIKIYERNNLI